MAIYFFRRAANVARQTIGKPIVADYTVRHQPGSIQRAFETALYQDARAAQLIEKRDLALAEAKRQVAPTTK
jgi:hypothetical protein